MKLDVKTLDYMLSVITVANIVKIDSVIIEPNRVRGMLEDNSVVLLHDENVPPLPFGSIGMTRLDVFSSRYELAKMCGDLKIEVDIAEDKKTKETFARSITMKGNGVKVEYRCANPAVIKAYKTINDPIRYGIKILPEAVLMMVKGQIAMNSECVSLISEENNGVSFEMRDITGDTMSYKIDSTVIVVDGASRNFTFTYSAKTLLPLLKQALGTKIEITVRGVIKLNVHGFNVYVLPRT